MSRAREHSLNGLLKLTAIIALLALTTGLAGCGRRGALEAPPTPESIAKQQADNADPTRPHPRPKPQKIAPPKQPFFLDPLL